MTQKRETVDIITPSAVQARYFGFVLENGVKCIIIQDENAKIPAAAMSIRAGQLNDPECLPGMAHFCEHMLFMGTSKYPSEDEYNAFISKNGGHCNAWTADSNTTYYFTVSHDALEGALERFLEFFVTPSFNSSALAREVKAVHSEDEKNHSEDFWRLDELRRSLFDPRHPRYRYGNGNLTTLWDEPRAKNVDIREELIKFFETYYVSEAACLAVYSAFPPETVLRIVEPPLLKMRIGKPPAFRFLNQEDPLLGPKGTIRGLWLNVRTVKKQRKVRVDWPVMSPAAAWRSMPSAYVSHVLGHECDSSVLGVLRRGNLATAMVVGPVRVDDDNEVMCVEITLTIDGFRRIVDVIDLLYQGIGQVARVNSAVYAQMKAEEKLSFESSDISGFAEHCAELAGSANKANLRHSWVAETVVLDDDIAATEAYTAQLTPENGVVTLLWGEMPCDIAEEPSLPANEENEREEDEEEGCEEDDGEDKEEDSPLELFNSLPDFARFACSSTTRFHKTKFSRCRVPDEILARWAANRSGPWHPELSLPSINPFLATDFTVHGGDGSGKAIVETLHTPYGVTVLRRGGENQKSFKASLIWSGLSPCVYASAKSRFYMRVLKAILNDAIAEIRYFGLLAALENNIEITAGGLCLSVAGPEHRLFEFFIAIFEKAFTSTILCGSAERYNSYKEEELRRLQSSKSRQPYMLASDRFLKAAKVITYTFDEVLEAAASTSYSEYRLFIKEYLETGVSFECFVAGNVSSEKYVQKKLIEGVEETFSRLNIPPACKESIPRFRDAYAFNRISSTSQASPLSVLIYPPFDKSNPNVALLFNIYIGEESPHLRVLCDCVDQLISSSFFDALRTKETLGYIVFSQSTRLEATMHLQLVAQSAVEGVDGTYLLSRIIAFLEAVESNLETICAEAEVKTVVNALIERRRKLPSSVGQDAFDLLKRHLHPAGFDYKELEIEALKQLDPAKVKEFFHTYVANSSVSRSALAIVVHNAASAGNNDALDGREGECHRIDLPPRRAIEAAMGDDTNASNETALQLPDFVAKPMSIFVHKYSSPEDFHRGFPIVHGKAF